MPALSLVFYTAILCNFGFSAMDVGNYKSTGQLNTCTARHECSFVQAGTSFYLMGGRETNQIEEYNFATHLWTGKATAPTVINHFQATNYGGLIWAICGFADNAFPDEKSLDKIYMYDPVQDKWFTGASIPPARMRGSTGVIQYNGEFYIISGNNHGHDCGGQVWTDKWNPATNTWKILKDGPRKRDHFHAILYQDKIYNIGGRHSSSGCTGGTFGNTYKEIDIYDIPSDTWSTSPNLDFVDRAAPVIGMLGNEIVALGGEHATNTTVTIVTAQAFNLSTNTWRTLTSLPTSGDAQGRHATQGIVSNGVLWAAAGSKSQGGNKINTFFGYYIDNANAANSPSGTPIVPGSFAFSTNKLVFSDTASALRTNSISLNYTSGNQGILISNIVIDQKGFSLKNTNGFPWFLAPNTSLSIEIVFDPKAYVAPAQMTITTVVPSTKQYTVTLEKGTTGIAQERAGIHSKDGMNAVPASNTYDLQGRAVPTLEKADAASGIRVLKADGF